MLAVKKPQPMPVSMTITTMIKPNKIRPNPPDFFLGFFARPVVARFAPAARFSMEILLITNLFPFYHILPIRAGVFSLASAFAISSQRRSTVVAPVPPSLMSAKLKLRTLL